MIKIISAVAIIASVFALSYGLTQQERQECAQWAHERESLTGAPLRLFIEQWQNWQDQQCEAVGVRVF
jgi:hypothetical protein